MTKKHALKLISITLLFITTFLISGCAASSWRPPVTVIVWHSWPEAEAAMLRQTVERFERIFDDAEVVLLAVPQADMLSRYRQTVDQGLGPDLFIGPNTWMRELVDEERIAPLPNQGFETSNYYTTAITTLTINGQLYGVPFSMQPLALYYNQAMVETPPRTLDALLEEAAAGRAVAIDSRFANLVWGISAFGGRILNDEGRIVLDEGGFANWLSWLLLADDTPGVFISRDPITLRNLFLRERVAYYTARPAELQQLRDGLGDDLAVALLPDGPNAPAAPFLNLDTIMLNPASSDAQREQALRLAAFLTNVEQSTTFMRDLGRVPANRRVRVDPLAYPIISAFITQARTAQPVPDYEQIDLLLRVADETLLRVQEGVIDPAAAASEITQTVNLAAGFEEVTVEAECQFAGDLRVLHILEGVGQQWLGRVTSIYQRNCPDVEITLEYVPRSEALAVYQDALLADDPPDLFIGSGDWLPSLAVEGVVSSLPTELLQPFLPNAQSAVQWQGVTYGLPIAVEIQTLYSNISLVSDLALTLDEWLTQAETGTTVALPRSFDESFWGWVTTGAVSVDDAGNLQLDEAGIVNWLTWLQSVTGLPNVQITSSARPSREAFEQGELAYYVGANTELDALQDALGDQLDVSILPTSATGGAARPKLHVYAIYLPPNGDSVLDSDATDEAPTVDVIDDADILRLDFAQTMVNAQNQVRLVELARWLSANTGAVGQVENDPLLAELLAQVRSALVVPQTPENQILAETADMLVTRLLLDMLSPEAVAQELVATALEEE